MAHKKGAGSTKNGRDSNSKCLGIKVYGNQRVKSGGVIVRQRGLTFKPGKGVRVGRDFTIFALQEGTVKFEIENSSKFVSVFKLEGGTLIGCQKHISYANALPNSR
jgi:large subunit ribosomal protein L27